MVGLLLGACGGALDPEQARREMVEQQMRSSYTTTIASIRPAYVFVTYPGTIGSMAEHKRRELDIVRGVLRDKTIPHKVVDRATVLETLTVGKREPHDVQAYRVPDDVAPQCRGRTVLFLNLDVREPLQTVRHPDAVKSDITVQVWDDPVKLHGRGTS